MINHVRTLLLNETGASAYAPDYPGEEYVPTEYVKVRLPTNLLEPYSILFGQNSDRAKKNVLLRTYMTLIHAIPKLAAHVYSFDPRVTYHPGDSNIFDYFLSGPKVTKLLDYGYCEVRDYFNFVPGARIWYEYVLLVKAGNVLEISYTNDSGESTTVDLPFTVSGELSNPVTLPLTDMKVVFDPLVGFGWKISALFKPKEYIEDILKSVYDNLSIEALSNLFMDNSEAIAQLNTLWDNSPDAPTRLGSIVLALAYGIEDKRNGNN